MNCLLISVTSFFGLLIILVIYRGSDSTIRLISEAHPTNPRKTSNNIGEIINEMVENDVDTEFLDKIEVIPQATPSLNPHSDEKKISDAINQYTEEIYYANCSRCLETTTKISKITFSVQALDFTDCRKEFSALECSKKFDVNYIVSLQIAVNLMYCRFARIPFDLDFCRRYNDSQLMFTPMGSSPMEYCTEIGYCRSKEESIMKCIDIFSRLREFIPSGNEMSSSASSAISWASIFIAVFFKNDASDPYVVGQMFKFGSESIFRTLLTRDQMKFCAKAFN